MVTTDKVQGMQRKVVLVTVGVIALAVVAAKLFAPSYVTSLRQTFKAVVTFHSQWETTTSVAECVANACLATLYELPD
jgi:hypothetical protein